MRTHDTYKRNNEDMISGIRDAVLEIGEGYKQNLPSCDTQDQVKGIGTQ
ncbi:MAG: hypothetical protein ACP5N2_00535 [Candidatus Nanoarchaeia archaeon]